jgi:hypothetical protein
VNACAGRVGALTVAPWPRPALRPPWPGLAPPRCPANTPRRGAPSARVSPAGSGRIAPAIAGPPDPPALRLAVPRCARLCQIVPRTHRRTPPPAPQPARFEPTDCTLYCTLVRREIEIAPKWPFLARSRGATRWVLQDSNHEPEIVPGCARLCQIVPMCATWRRLWRSARRAIVPGCARSCQVVTGAIAHSVAHSGSGPSRGAVERAAAGSGGVAVHEGLGGVLRQRTRRARSSGATARRTRTRESGTS